MGNTDKFEFLTIRQAARLGVLSEYRLRRLVAQGQCPGIYAGRKFLVNLPLLRQYLAEQSLRPAHGSERGCAQ